MDNSALILQVGRNIEFQEGKLNFLRDAREKTSLEVLWQSAQRQGTVRDISTANQALTDALLNAMASLIDYYYMHCLLRLGAAEGRLTRIQYRPMNNLAVVATPPHKGSSLVTYRSNFDEELKRLSKLELGDISGHDYWPAFFGDAIVSYLFNAGALDTPRFQIEFSKEKGFEINKSVRQYHELTQRFYCNKYSCGGVKYNIYIDINNCLKHNIVPYSELKHEHYGDEERAYFYAKLKKSDSVFLKSGLLKTLVELDFEALRADLRMLYEGEKGVRSELALAWEMDDIISVDKQNGYLNDDQSLLFFFIDGVLMAKSSEATYVDVGVSLKRVLGTLWNDIKYGMNLDFSTSPKPNAATA